MKKDYFSEKAQQVEPKALSAFGINVSSRYGKADELVEMLNFARLAATKGVAHYVREVFYDSKAYMCSIEIDPTVKDGDPIATKLHSAAEEAIAQFDWFGYVDHGANLAKENEA